MQISSANSGPICDEQDIFGKLPLSGAHMLELGCGKGEYTVKLAQHFPDINFVGIDIKGSRMWKGAWGKDTGGLACDPPV